MTSPQLHVTTKLHQFWPLLKIRLPVISLSCLPSPLTILFGILFAVFTHIFCCLVCLVPFLPHHAGSTSVHSSRSITLLFPIPQRSSVLLLPVLSVFFSDCLLPSLQIHCFPLTLSSSAPLSSSFYRLFSHKTHNNISSNHFHSCLPPLICPLPWFPLSSQWRGFQRVLLYFLLLYSFLLSQIPHLHQLPSSSLSHFPPCVPSLFCSIIFMLTLVFFIPYSTPSSPGSPHHPLTFLSPTNLDMQFLLSLSRAIFFFLHST